MIKQPLEDKVAEIIHNRIYDAEIRFSGSVAIEVQQARERGVKNPADNEFHRGVEAGLMHALTIFEKLEL